MFSDRGQRYADEVTATMEFAPQLAQGAIENERAEQGGAVIRGRWDEGSALGSREILRGQRANHQPLPQHRPRAKAVPMSFHHSPERGAGGVIERAHHRGDIHEWATI